MDNKVNFTGRIRSTADSTRPAIQRGDGDDVIACDAAAAAKAAFWAGSSLRLHADMLEQIATEILACKPASGAASGRETPTPQDEIGVH